MGGRKQKMGAWDPDNPRNGPKYYSGQVCEVSGCTKPAGTRWSPFWCWRHNAERLDRISAGLREATDRLRTNKEPPRETIKL